MSDRSRRLLMIARHFPPLNVSGAARLESFARHLSADGWATTVVSARGDGASEGGLEQELPASCRVVRAFAADAKALFSVFGRYPAVLAFPDRSAPWIIGGSRQALRCCRRERFDALLSTSPDVSAHCIGFVTKRVSGLPWIIDLRDPWNNEAQFGRFLARLDDRLERFLLASADAITVTAPGMVEEITRIHGTEIGRKTHLVRNGFEEDALQRAFSSAAVPASFHIVHAGDTSYRDTASFLRALRTCLDRGTVSADVSVELIGSGESDTLQKTPRDLDLGSVVRSTPRVALRIALDSLARAAVLLLLQPQPVHRLCIPVKSYEYLRSGRRILAVTDARGETGRLLRDFAGVWIAPPGDIEEIATSLEAIHASWKADPGRVFERDVAAYTRRHQASELRRLLESLASTPPESRR